MQQLTQKMAFLETQNENYVAENQALRQAQIEMEERHTAEIIELKHSQLSAVKNESFRGEQEPEDYQMLINLVKVKDEEIQ